MQTGIERLDDLSQESRKQLKEQIARVQKEARKLRAQARRLRRAQHAETRQRKKLLAQIAESSKNWGQDMLQRGSNLASSGVAQAGSQLRSGQQKALEYSGGLAQGLGQLGSDTNSRLLQQGRQLGRNASDWGDETAYRLRKQGRQLGWNASDWGDETAYHLRKQGRTVFQRVADWGDEAAYQARRRGRNLGHNLGERKEDLARQLYLRKRGLGRNLSEGRDDATHQLRVRGRQLGRNLSGKRDDAVRQVRKQRDYLSERGGQLLEPVRGSGFWSVLGFVAGLLLAGGITYWLIKRILGQKVSVVEENIELEPRESFNSVNYRPGGKIRTVGLGGTAVVTRTTTSAGPTTRFVGVQSSQRYYPIGLHPDTRDLIYFENEEDARAEGFSPAEE
ncbi:MAG TPA: hypothetical protein VF458_12130 [Ktedonobacteraceae bacterium]